MYSIKIGIIGNPMTGKTSLSMRYIENKFRREYKPTLGLNIYYKQYITDRFKANVVFWDMAGHERYINLRKNYYSGINGIILSYDTYKGLDYDRDILPWFIELLSIVRDLNMPMAIIGNKIDLLELAEKSKLEIEQVKKDILSYTKYELTRFFLTSAKSGDNVENAFNWVIETAIRNQMKTHLNLS